LLKWLVDMKDLVMDLYFDIRDERIAKKVEQHR